MHVLVDLFLRAVRGDGGRREEQPEPRGCTERAEVRDLLLHPHHVVARQPPAVGVGRQRGRGPSRIAQPLPPLSDREIRVPVLLEPRPHFVDQLILRAGHIDGFLHWFIFADREAGPRTHLVIDPHPQLTHGHEIVVEGGHQVSAGFVADHWQAGKMLVGERGTRRPHRIEVVVLGEDIADAHDRIAAVEDTTPNDVAIRLVGVTRENDDVVAVEQLTRQLAVGGAAPAVECRSVGHK